MKRLELVRRVRSLTRDFSNSIFREQDIVDFINEGIDRMKQSIVEFKDIPMLLAPQQEVILIPEPYQHLLALYSTSRCYSQDEGHYQATNYMNEFEIKLDELKIGIYSGDIKIVDSDGKEVIGSNDGVEYVDLSAYYGNRHREE